MQTKRALNRSLSLSQKLEPKLKEDAKKGSGWLHRLANTKLGEEYADNHRVKKDACSTQRAGTKRDGWKEQWQHGQEVQNKNPRSWAMKSTNCHQQIARSYKKTTSLGTDAFHPRVLSDLFGETCKRGCKFLAYS